MQLSPKHNKKSLNLSNIVTLDLKKNKTMFPFIHLQAENQSSNSKALK